MSFRDHLTEHIDSKPRVEPQDLYKFAYQAAMGPAHAISGRTSAREYLLDEIGATRPSNAELIEPLADDSSIVRVHLGPYKTHGHDPDALLDAFLKTANHYTESSEKLHAYLDILREVASDAATSVDHKAVVDFLDVIEERGFPAVKHSESYRQLYDPAYRVVSPQYLNLSPTESSSS